MDETSFLARVREHRLEVLVDRPPYRHLCFSAPNTGIDQFHLHTWPGYLCYSGDMGCYVFQRLFDMLEFFRGPDTGQLRVNLPYWAEKLQAIDLNDPPKVYSADVARAAVEGHMEDCEWPDEIREEARDHIGCAFSDGEYALMSALQGFRSGRYEFADYWEIETRAWSGRFRWACFAIPWGIRLYDQYCRAQK